VSSGEVIRDHKELQKYQHSGTIQKKAARNLQAAYLNKNQKVTLF
jgi:hypothetical protein